MKILVINSGSSSIKSQLFLGNEVIFKGHVDRIGDKESKLITEENSKKSEENVVARNHLEAIDLIFNKIIQNKIINNLEEISGVGHRVVHGGEIYKDSVLIDEAVIKNIEKLSDFAPLHNPPNLVGIKACIERLGEKIPQIAVFDTAFHSTISKEKYLYALPREYYEKYKIRKYGFHGTSFKFLAQIMKKKRPRHKKIVLCHIGNGSSICAIKEGKSVNTSMGFTPLAGLVMGTRSGDIDPALIEIISRKEKINISEVTNILNKKSGLKGVCGDSDMRNIWERIQKGDKTAEVALNILSESIVKYVSYYISNLNGVDSIVFSAGLGENAPYLREKIIKNLAYLGVILDKSKNELNSEVISSKESKIEVLVIPTNEELMISKEVTRLL